MISQNQFEHFGDAGNSTANEAFDGVLSCVKPMALAILAMVGGCILGIIVIAFSRSTSSGGDGMNTKPKAHPADSQSTGVDAAPLFTPKDFQR